jgi:acyl-CoA dehydrogenase
MLLLARTTPVDEVKRRTDGLSVPRRSARESWAWCRDPADRSNDQPQHHRGVFLQSPSAPENLIGEEGRGFRYILDGMNAERILVAQECIGDGRWLLNKGIEYAKERIVFDRTIGQNQGVQFPLARAYAELEAADMICRRRGIVRRRPGMRRRCQYGQTAALTKLLPLKAGWHAPEATMTTFRGFAFAREYDIERKWREIRLYRTAPISTNLIFAYIGEQVLGMPRSY